MCIRDSAVLEVLAAQQRILDIRALEHAAVLLANEAGARVAIVADGEEVAGPIRIGVEAAFKAHQGALVAALNPCPQGGKRERCV